MRSGAVPSYGPSMQLRRLLLPIVVLVPLTACGSDGDDAAEDDPVAATEVAVVDNDFEPAVVTVDVGATVTWTWDGSNPHDVGGDGFASDIQTSGSFEHTFDQAGEYEYYCSLHSGMRGRVVVR
jgi:plastocyanin